MDRTNFDFSKDNISTTNWYITIGFILFMIVSNYPIELWSKSPYFFGTILAVYLFQSLMLCPTAHNGNKAVGF